MNKVCKKALLSEKFEVDNSGDAARSCVISAVVTVSDGAVTRVERGRVVAVEALDAAPAEGPTGGVSVADFDRLFGNRLNVRFGVWDGHENSEVLSMVEAFIADCEAMAAGV